MTTTRRPVADELLRALPKAVPITDAACDALEYLNPKAAKWIIAALTSANLVDRIEEIDGWQSKDDPTWRQILIVFDSQSQQREARQALRNAAADALGAAIESHPELADDLADTISFKV